MAEPPPGAEPGGDPRVPVLRGDERGDGHEMVRIGCMTQAEQERDPERDDQRRPREEPGEPVVRGFERDEEGMEVDHPSRSFAHLGQRPATGKWLNRASYEKRLRMRLRTSSSSEGSTAMWAPHESQSRYSRGPSEARA